MVMEMVMVMEMEMNITQKIKKTHHESSTSRRWNCYKKLDNILSAF
ncbi:MAG: hypothetical protein ACJA2S_005123 [Cyclobacteriaceae bacterium]|jgi:hypothetical protein